MATIPQTAPTQLPLPQPDTSPPSLSWEGEKMFNIYIWDYCSKRGFRNTARELMNEADIAPDSTPPINARQGLLFEWWSVFWVLFTAKANGSGSDEAILYTQHQANQLAQRQATHRLPPHGQGLPPGQQPQSGMPHAPPPPMARLANGIAPRHPMMAFGPNGPMSNGVGPNQGPMQSGGPNAFPMGGAPQPNGISGPPGPPGSSSGQGQNFQTLLPGQRPSISSMGGAMQPQQPPQQPGQIRGPNGPFQSPNMSNSPQNPPGQQPSQHQSQHSQPPMAQLSGPSPNLQHINRGGMLPPNQGMNPMNPQQGPSQPGNAPPQYQQRSPSRAATPSQGQGGMMQPSPSMANRQPPGLLPGGMSESNINSQIFQMPTMILSQIKQDLGLENKDVSTFTAHDKQRIVGLFRSKQLQQQQNKSDGVAPGPSNMMMQQQNQQQRNNTQQRNQQQQPQQPQQRGKRSSTSPGEEHDNLPRTESSPPERKRPRPSPSEQPAIPNMNFNPQLQQQPSGPQMMMGPQGGQGVMVMRGPQGMGMNGGGPQPNQSPMGGGMNMSGMNMGPMGVSHMGGGSMNPQMNHPSNLMQNQMQAREQAMRHQQQAILSTKGPQQPGVLGNMTGNAGSPPSTDPSSFNMSSLGQSGPGFGPGPNRMGAKTMMPPPSPAMNGPPKDQNGSGGLAKNPNQNPNMPANHSSPRNPPPNSAPNNSGQTPNANGTGPSTPAPGNSQNQNQGPPGQNQGSGLGITGQNMAPSPSSILGVPPSMNTSGQPPLSGDMSGAGIFTTDFIQNIASSLDEFDTGIFRPDGDINFERDFGQWFNPDDVPNLEMK